ncbi:MAG: EamA family transporter [Planctomycetes bacterium]|nr:EamA family transporter [Planctomycetota bacterium]
MAYRGELCALLTAACWACSSTAFAYASRRAGSLAANHFRLVAAVPLLLLLAWLSTGSAWPATAADDRMLLLVASGLVGLVLGDIGLFHALAVLGPRVSSVVMAGWPAVTVAIEAARGHAPTPLVVLGVLVTIAGVVLVLLRSRGSTAWNPGLTARTWTTGLLGALLGAVGQAGGFVLVREGMAPGADFPGGLDPLLATVVRMTTGVVGVQLVLVAQRQPFALARVARDRHSLLPALLGALFGPVLGVWLSTVAAREAHDLGVASSLMATTPIFLMPIAAWTYGARIGWLGLFGTVLAVAGAVLSSLAGHR